MAVIASFFLWLSDSILVNEKTIMKCDYEWYIGRMVLGVDLCVDLCAGAGY